MAQKTQIAQLLLAQETLTHFFSWVFSVKQTTSILACWYELAHNWKTEAVFFLFVLIVFKEPKFFLKETIKINKVALKWTSANQYYLCWQYNLICKTRKHSLSRRKNTDEINLFAKGKNVMGYKRKIVSAELLDFVVRETAKMEHSGYHGIWVLLHCT